MYKVTNIVRQNIWQVIPSVTDARKSVSHMPVKYKQEAGLLLKRTLLIRDAGAP